MDIINESMYLPKACLKLKKNSCDTKAFYIIYPTMCNPKVIQSGL